MFEFCALTYGMLASFLMASFSRNRRDRRSNPLVLTLFGWLLLSFSAATGAMLLGYAGLEAAGIATA